MNRHERRAQKAAARRAAVNPIVACHEAGHALARFLTADLMGLMESEAVDRIDVGAVTTIAQRYVSADGMYELSSQAVTYGQMFSAEIEAISKDMATEMGLDTQQAQADYWNRPEYIGEVITDARKRGADVESWLRARCVIAIGGAMGEFLAGQGSFMDLLESPECESDLADFIRDCNAAGVGLDCLDDYISDAHDWLAKRLQEPGIYDAYKAVAARIRYPGTIPGAEVARIIRQAIDQNGTSVRPEE